MRGDLGADAAVARRLVHDDEPPGVRDGVEDRLVVDGLIVARSITSQLTPSVGELLGGLQRLVRHRAPGDDRDVLALAQDVAGVERQRLAVVRDFLLHEPVDARRLEEHDRIRIADRREQQAVGARGRGGA